MAFKLPLPVKQKSCAPSSFTATPFVNLNIPIINKSDLTDIAMIGQGSFGNVFKATNKLTNETLLIKEIGDKSEHGIGGYW
jgi:hypothetical protein